MKKSIDINADVGEGIGNDASLMPYLSSCNIACGGHAGNLETMTATVELAKLNSVKIGAHPSFPDKINFGRVDMNISCSDLYTSLKQQVRGLLKILEDHNLQLHHIKPHGALYNQASKDKKLSQVIIEVIQSIALPLKLYAPCNSVLANLAVENGISVTFEAFIDRNYNDDLSLVSRSSSNALIKSKEHAWQHLEYMVARQSVKTISGKLKPIKASTYCIHGDNEKALAILKYLHSRLKEMNFIVR